jgi:galactonate dehydratase
MSNQPLTRRRMLNSILAGATGLSFLDNRANAFNESKAAIDPKDNIKITKLETFALSRTRSVFLKVHTDAGIVGLGEPSLEGWAPTIQTAIEEMGDYLIGKDPRCPVHHWQAIYRHAFYRGGPVLTSALSGIDMALWDIKGKALGVPVYELLGGPTRDRIRVYSGSSNVQQGIQQGFQAFKSGPAGTGRILDSPRWIDDAVSTVARMREQGGPDIDIGIDFHGRYQMAMAQQLIKAFEPYRPMFIEEPIPAQNVDEMAELAKKTTIPIATGERIFTKWGFREILEKKAATLLQPDITHCGGITELKIISGMAEAYYVGMMPHSKEGIIGTTASMHVMAAIPNFVIHEFATLGEGYIKEPFKVNNGYVMLPKGPGLGIELDENAIESIKNVGNYNFPQLYDPYDGSVLDW